jgi:hypothetical protein
MRKPGVTLFSKNSIPPLSKKGWKAFFLFLAILLAGTSISFAQEEISTSGRIYLRGVQKLDSGSVTEYPSAEGRLKLDINGEQWKFHSWLEGGWDGTVRRPIQDNSLFKNYDDVYQSNTPYLEFKELFATWSTGSLDVRAGIQRFAWGRLDEYPANDLLNPWDYTRFIRRSLEDRKIGVASLSASWNSGDWTVEPVWIPFLVPYRLPMPYERWALSPIGSAAAQLVPNALILPAEPDLPDRRVSNSNAGLRVKHGGQIEWALNLFHGYDPRPVFRTTALSISPQPGFALIDPGYVPSFHRITSVGMDAAAVLGDLSLRAEIAYANNRYLNIRRELWGYPAIPSPGIHPLNPEIEQKHDTLDYGMGADYRLFEDALLTVQAQQTFIFGNVDLLYERQIETLLWANVKIGFMNQKIETNLNMAYNPEHGDYLCKVNGWYVISDSWKAGAAYVSFTGPDQSIFGRYSQNDQLEAEVVYAW